MKECKVFDWDKAAQLMKENNATTAAAGLKGDWESTVGVILKEGEVVEPSPCHLQSTRSIPTLVIDDTKEYECFLIESEAPNWKNDGFWTESAKLIYKGLN